MTAMPFAARRAVSMLLLLFLVLHCSSAGDNLNLRPRQSIHSVPDSHRFNGRSDLESDHFKLLEIDGDSLMVGARDAVYNLSIASLRVQHVLEWSPPAQTIEECLMKGKSKTECHNYIRVMARQANGRFLICGTHAFSPKCREYQYSADEGGSLRDRRQFDGQAIAPYDPSHNSSAVYLAETNEILAATVSDFAGNDPLIYRKKLSDGGIDLRTQRDDLRVLDSPQFVSSFEDGDHVYFWYREHAAEATDSDGKQVYARVARVCKKDRGGARPAAERWTSFVKARLNCSLPGHFYFNELQSVSDPVSSSSSDGGDVVYAVFSTPESAVRMSAICAFRMDAVRRIFDVGDFKYQRTPNSLYTPFRSYDLPTPRPGSCVPDSTKLSETVLSFILKNPLMNGVVEAIRHRPLLVEGVDRPSLTQIAVAANVLTVSGQAVDAIFVGTVDGRVVKLVDVGAGRTTVVEAVRVFDRGQAIVNLLVAGERLIVVSADEIASVPLAHCEQQRSCSGCVFLQDPHCAWDQDTSRCVANVHGKWKDGGSLVQNVQLGRSEQCPEGAVDQELYAIDDSAQPDRMVAIAGFYSGQSLALAILLSFVVALAIGFLAGYRISRWRFANTGVQHHSNSSTSGSDYESYGRARLTRHDSLGATAKIDHVYGTTPHTKMDAVSLVMNLPASSISNGGSGITTPRTEKNLLTSLNGTLPKDYKVKKVYL